MATVYILLIILSLFIGSFLNVAAVRVPRGESVIAPPSRCMNCGTRLMPLDLLPLFSCLLFRGKCRHCGQPYSSLYFWGELATMCLFLLVFKRFGFSLETLAGFVLASILITVTISDLLYKIIPDKVLITGMILLLALRLWHHPQPVYSYLLGMIVGATLVFITDVLSHLLLRKEGMGGGDLKLFALIGLALGWKLTLLSFAAACVIGAFAGTLLLIGKKVKRGDYIPFAPAIAAGTLAVYLWGEQWTEWYLRVLI